MGTFLGLLGVAAFIPCVITLAASVTWLVVKLSPPADDQQSKPASS
jgi:hypothetical protein